MISLTGEVRFRAVGDEGVVVHLESGRVLVVNEVGLYILQHLKEPATPEILASSIAAEFNVSREQAATDLDVFLAELDGEDVLARARKKG